MWALIASSGVLVAWTCESDTGEHTLSKKQKNKKKTKYTLFLIM